jgi:hypothetical protein
MAEEFNFEIIPYIKAEDVQRISPIARDSGYTLADLDEIEALGRATAYVRTLLNHHVTTSLQLEGKFKSDIKTLRAILNINQNIAQLVEGFNESQRGLITNSGAPRNIIYNTLDFGTVYNINVCGHGKILMLETIAERDKRIEQRALEISRSIGSSLYKELIARKKYEDLSELL